MKTIYLLQKTGRYSTGPKILRAFESRVDAEDLVTIMGRADVEGLEIVEIELETAQPHTPAPMQPRVTSGLGLPDIQPDFRRSAIAKQFPENSVEVAPNA